MAKRAIVARAPVDGASLGCPAVSVSVSSGGVGGSRLSDVGVNCRTPVGAGTVATARWQTYSSCRGPSTSEGVSSSRRCIGEGSDWGALQGATKVGKFPAEELQ